MGNIFTGNESPPETENVPHPMEPILEQLIYHCDLNTSYKLSLTCTRAYHFFRQQYYRTVTVIDLAANQQKEACLFYYQTHYYINLPYHETVIVRDDLQFNHSCCKHSRPDDKEMFTIWGMIRFDPETLLVHTGDITFAKTQGYWKQVGLFVPYAMCYACESPHQASGVGNIDLRGTPFAVEDDFHCNGWLPNGAFEKKCSDQIVSIKGGGFCGWMCTVRGDKEGEDVLKRGGWHLKLKLINN